MSINVLCVSAIPSRREGIKTIFNQVPLEFIDVAPVINDAEKARVLGHVSALKKVETSALIVEDDITLVGQSVTYPTEVLSVATNEIRLISQPGNSVDSIISPLDVKPYSNLPINALPSSITDCSAYIIGSTAAKMVLANDVINEPTINIAGLLMSTTGVLLTKYTPPPGTIQPLMNGSRVGTCVGTVRCSTRLDLNGPFMEILNDHGRVTCLDTFDETYLKGSVHPAWYALRASIASSMGDGAEALKSLKTFHEVWSKTSGLPYPGRETGASLIQTLVLDDAYKGTLISRCQ